MNQAIRSYFLKENIEALANKDEAGVWQLAEASVIRFI
jgi:hypothetical protein